MKCFQLQELKEKTNLFVSFFVFVYSKEFHQLKKQIELQRHTIKSLIYKHKLRSLKISLNSGSERNSSS